MAGTWTRTCGCEAEQSGDEETESQEMHRRRVNECWLQSEKSSLYTAGLAFGGVSVAEDRTWGDMGRPLRRSLRWEKSVGDSV